MSNKKMEASWGKPDCLDRYQMVSSAPASVETRESIYPLLAFPPSGSYTFSLLPFFLSFSLPFPVSLSSLGLPSSSPYIPSDLGLVSIYYSIHDFFCLYLPPERASSTLNQSVHLRKPLRLSESL